MKGIKHFSSPVNLLSQKCSTSESSILTANWQDYLLCNRFLLTPKNLFTTRLHSIRMRTARVSPSMLCAGIGDGGGAGGLVPGVSALGVCVPGPGGCLLWGMYLVPGGGSALGGVCSGGVPGPGGVCSGGCTWSGGVSALGGSAQGGCQVLFPCEQNDKQVKKYYLAPNFV